MKILRRWPEGVKAWVSFPHDTGRRPGTRRPPEYHGLTWTQIKVLRALFDAIGPMTFGDVALALRCDISVVRRAIFNAKGSVKTDVHGVPYTGVPLLQLGLVNERRIKTDIMDERVFSLTTLGRQRYFETLPAKAPSGYY